MRTTIAAALVIAFCASTASGRKWTDATGKYTIEAEFVEVQDGKVRLKKEDGSVIAVAIDKLSQADREYLDGLQKKAQKERPAAPPKAKAESKKPTAEADAISELPEAWQRDWKEFLQANEKLHSAHADDVNRAFAGRIVQWTGRFERVNEHGNVLVTMEPAKAKSWVISPKNWSGQLEMVNTSRLLLSPVGDESAKWSKLRKGEKVVFRTKLTQELWGSVVIAVRAGDWLMVGTEGAQLMRVISGDGKASEGEDYGK